MLKCVLIQDCCRAAELKNSFGIESTTELNKREQRVYDLKCIIKHNMLN